MLLASGGGFLAAMPLNVGRQPTWPIALIALLALAVAGFTVQRVMG